MAASVKVRTSLPLKEEDSNIFPGRERQHPNAEVEV
jgi:hypothetical protein